MNDINNYYRPISITSILGKIIEKLLFKQITEYIGNQNILNQRQFYFQNEKIFARRLISKVEHVRTIRFLGLNLVPKLNWNYPL